MLEERQVQQQIPENTGRVAGFWYVVASAMQFFNYAYVLPTLVTTNPTTTANNILVSEWLFRAGAVSEIVGATALLLCVRSLYSLLSCVNKTRASLMLSFIVVSVPISFLNVLNEFAAVTLVHGGSSLSYFTQSQLNDLASLFLNLHAYGLDIVNILWGLWLIPFGLLVYRSGSFPRILGIFLIMACFAYVTESLISLLGLSYWNVASIFADVMGALGEATTMVWLLVKNPKGSQVESRLSV